MAADLTELLKEMREQCEKATKGPWEWDAGENEPQLLGNVEAPEFNPVLIARGCGNDKRTSAHVRGCMPDRFNDPLRACPLHPSKEDRDHIARSRTLVPALISVVEVAVKELKTSTCDDRPAVQRRAVDALSQITTLLTEATK